MSATRTVFTTTVAGEHRGTKGSELVIEVRFHGRGGQGAVTAAELLAQAAIGEDRYAQGFPSFGAERRGAPVAAYLRVSESIIHLREKIDEPTAVVILDSSLLRAVDVLQGLRKGGTVILNAPVSEADELAARVPGYALAVVDADRIATDTLGIPIGNTAMIGALVRATGLVRLDSLEEPVSHRFGQQGQGNLLAIRRAYDETVLVEAHNGAGNEAGTTAPSVEPDALHPWTELPIGCDVTRPGSTAACFTGNWRTSGKPVTDFGRCTKCGLCWIVCPDIAYSRNSEGFYDLDDRYCKGCGTCVDQCPTAAISLEAEQP